MTGGADSDRFVLSAGFGTDTITDFELGVDQIDVQRFGTVAISITSNGGDTELKFPKGDKLILTGVNAKDFDIKLDIVGKVINIGAVIPGILQLILD